MLIEKGQPVVSIFMMTYNHEKYISQAIEGVLMQKTDFPYELVIGEDQSTDKTREICEKYASNYPNKIKLLPSDKHYGAVQNQNRTFKACTGKYIAMCEGDDYWTDPGKLQKQVDFLEGNEEYGLVHTNARIVDEIGELIFEDRRILKPEGDVFFHLLTKSAFIVTCTVLFRRDLIQDIFNDNDINEIMMDYYLWLMISNRAKCHYIPEVTTSYRSHPEGITKSNINSLTSTIPKIVLNIVHKAILDNERKYTVKQKWQLYTAFYRSLLSKRVKTSYKKKFLQIIFISPLYNLAIFNSLLKKVSLKLRNSNFCKT